MNLRAYWLAAPLTGIGISAVGWLALRLSRRDSDPASVPASDAVVRPPASFALSPMVPGAPREGFGIISPQTGCVILSSIRSTPWAARLCFMRDYNLSGRGFRAAGYRCMPVTVSVVGPVDSAGPV